jgi:hypothetical protein
MHRSLQATSRTISQWNAQSEVEQLGIERHSDFSLIQPRDLGPMKMDVMHKSADSLLHSGPMIVTPFL